MRKKEKHEFNYIVIVLIIAVMILTVVRICSNTTKNMAFGISGTADGDVKMADARYLELELDAPIAGMTGFSFWFDGNRDNFENTGFLVTAAIENDPMNPQMLYEGVMPLIEQAYDYQNESYIIIVPFEGDIQQGDRLRIAIMGIDMSEEDNIRIKLSSQSGITGATFEINDFVQDSILAGKFYFQTRGLSIFSVLIQGIVVCLLILLVGEVIKKPKRKRKPVMSHSKISIKKRILSLLPFFLLLVLALDYTYYSGIKTQLQSIKLKDNVEFYPGKADTAFRELCDEESVFLECNVEENYLSGFEMYLKQPYDDNGVFMIEVSDLESQDLVVKAQRAIYEIQTDEEGLLKFDFDSPVKKSAGKEYLVSVYYTGEEPVELLAADGSKNPRLIPLYQKNTFLNLLFIIFSILIIVFTLVIILGEQNKLQLEKLFFLTIIFLGILFEIVITPFAVPDEAAHIDTVYRISNQLLGVEDTGIKDAIYKRECDIYTDSGIKRTIDVESYKWLYDDWFSAAENRNGKLTFAADVTPNANALYFLPAAISITVGRILGIGFLPMIYLARTANLLLVAWMIYQAVKKLPFGKSILCVIALLPITLQQIASCSYDALIIGVSILYVSYCVFAIYSKTKLEKTDILVILITAIMLGACKGGVYTPLYLLGIWILIKRGYIRFPQRREMKIVCIAVAVCIVLASIIGVVCVFKQSLDPYSLRNGYYPLAYLIQHPWETFRIVENTLYEGTYTYFRHLIGDGLGYFQVSLKFIIPIGYVLLLGKAVICSEKYPYTVDVPNKCVFLTAAALSFAAVHLAFLISYTVFGDKVIGGVQGRYFIPLLWLLLISLRSGRIVNKEKKYRKIVTMGYMLGIMSVMQVIIDVLGTVG